MTIKAFDHVILVDGREGAVVEVLGDQELFLVDIGSSPEDWETIEVRIDQIKKVIS